MDEEIKLLNFPSISYLTLLDMKSVKEVFSQYSKVETSDDFQEKWQCGEVSAYYRDLERRHEMRLEGSCMKTVNDLHLKLREIMIKQHNIFFPFKGEVTTVYPGKNDSADVIAYIGEFGNALGGSQAVPNPNIATDRIILEIAERNGVDILTGETTTKYARISRSSSPFPDSEDSKYLVMCPVCIRGTVNRALKTAVELRDKDKKRIFENLSVYDSEGRLIKGVDRGVYGKISTKQTGTPLKFIV